MRVIGCELCGLDVAATLADFLVLVSCAGFFKTMRYARSTESVPAKQLVAHGDGFSFAASAVATIILQFLNIKGLGLNARIGPGVVHSFFASQFCHNTAMAVGISDGRVFMRHEKYCLLAWGLRNPPGFWKRTRSKTGENCEEASLGEGCGDDESSHLVETELNDPEGCL